MFGFSIYCMGGNMTSTGVGLKKNRLHTWLSLARLFLCFSILLDTCDTGFFDTFVSEWERSESPNDPASHNIVTKCLIFITYTPSSPLSLIRCHQSYSQRHKSYNIMWCIVTLSRLFITNHSSKRKLLHYNWASIYSIILRWRVIIHLFKMKLLFLKTSKNISEDESFLLYI